METLNGLRVGDIVKIVGDDFNNCAIIEKINSPLSIIVRDDMGIGETLPTLWEKVIISI